MALCTLSLRMSVFSVEFLKTAQFCRSVDDACSSASLSAFFNSLFGRRPGSGSGHSHSGGGRPSRPSISTVPSTDTSRPPSASSRFVDPNTSDVFLSVID